MSEAIRTIPDLSGMKVDVVYTNCDTLAKEEWVNVYLSKAPGREPFLSRWFNRKTLIFSYDPGRSPVPALSITSVGPEGILISVEDVSSILFQSRKWRNRHIDYYIGQIRYP